jgi:excisionase family DNA binding protein
MSIMVTAEHAMIRPKDIDELRDDLLHGASEIAKYTGMSKRRIYNLIQKGLLPIRRLGHRTIIGRKSQINAALRCALTTPGA